MPRKSETKQALSNVMWVWTGLWMEGGRKGARDGRRVGVDGAGEGREGSGKEGAWKERGARRGGGGREGSETGGAWVWTRLWMEKGGSETEDGGERDGTGGAWWTELWKEEGGARDGRCMRCVRGRGGKVLSGTNHGGANAAPCFAAERSCASGAILRG